MSSSSERLTALLVAAAVLTGVAAAQTVKFVRTFAENTTIRSEPNERAAPLDDVPSGTFLEVVSHSGDWFQVRLPPDPRLGSARPLGYVSRLVSVPVTGAEITAAEAAVTKPIVRPPGEGITVGVDSQGKSLWLAPTYVRPVALQLKGKPDSVEAGLAVTEALQRPPARPASPNAQVTWVWVTPADEHGPVIGGSPSFFVEYRQVRGLDPPDWVPGIVRLGTAGTAWRLVTAIPGHADAASREAADWPIRRDMIETSMPVNIIGSGPGLMQMTVKTPLAPGEYAVVLRPAFDRLYRGRYLVGGFAGEGLAFGAVWRFTIQ